MCRVCVFVYVCVWVRGARRAVIVSGAPRGRVRPEAAAPLASRRCGAQALSRAMAASCQPKTPTPHLPATTNIFALERRMYSSL
ncbi:unnamed protein product [Toxocara canis]|uniref:Secreted protein n=1 Tax=Toxocara canis TaxID=6265 RepID=A0A183V7B3_TOXCA|nr:unnamed protein product [Toxocara canis]